MCAVLPFRSLRRALAGALVGGLLLTAATHTQTQAQTTDTSKAKKSTEAVSAPASKRGMLDWLIFWRDDRPDRGKAKSADSSARATAPESKQPPARLSDAASRKPKSTRADKPTTGSPSGKPTVARLPDPLREMPPTNPMARTVANSAEQQTDTTFGARVSGPYPNPASVEVRIDYTTGAAPGAVLRLYDFLGKTVRTLSLRRGSGFVTVEVGSLPPGLYFYSLEVEGKIVATRRMVVSR